MTPPVVVNISIFDLSQECFSLLQDWHVLHKPTHHLTTYIMSIGSLEISSSVYFEFLKETYCSYARTLLEPFQTLGGDSYHNEECQESL
jgi:hypothetical protein